MSIKKIDQPELPIEFVKPTRSEEGTKNFVKNSKEIRALIKSRKNSGYVAWIIGEKLQSAKLNEIFLAKYATFEEYVKSEFDITDTTAYNYIKIHERFKKDEIGDIVISHLGVIADIQSPTIRQLIVSLLRTVERKERDVGEIKALAALLGNSDELSANETREIFAHIRHISASEKAEKKRREIYGQLGPALSAPAIIGFEKRFEREPIDEMGVIVLFSILFERLCKETFQIGKDMMLFERIRYVQAPFPDCSVICRLIKPDRETEIHIEFEFQSFTYLLHRHHMSSKKCHLIVCWEENARSDVKKATSNNVQKLPPILELKDFLHTGRINLK